MEKRKKIILAIISASVIIVVILVFVLLKHYKILADINTNIREVSTKATITYKDSSGSLKTETSDPFVISVEVQKPTVKLPTPVPESDTNTLSKNSSKLITPPKHVTSSLSDGDDGSTQINLSWQEVSDSSVSYNIYRSVDGGSFEKIATTKNTTYNDTDILESQNIAYAVKSLQNGNESESSDITTISSSKKLSPSWTILVYVVIVIVVIIFVILIWLRKKSGQTEY